MKSFSLLFLLSAALVKCLPSGDPSEEVFEDGNSTEFEKRADVSVQGKLEPYLIGCVGDEAVHVMQAWREAGDIAYVHNQWSPKGQWQNAMNLYMGKDSKNDRDWATGKRPIGDNIDREYRIHYAGWGDSPVQTYLYIYCHESAVPRHKDDEDGDQCTKLNANAYSWNDLGNFWNNHYIVLCPPWWDFNTMRSLKEAVSTAARNKKFQLNINFWKKTRARVMLHETYHFEDTVSRPLCIDTATAPEQVVYLAKTGGSKLARLNAENFALAGIATYVMDKFHLRTVPRPQASRASASDADGTVKDDGNGVEVSFLKAPPKNFKALVDANAKDLNIPKSAVPMSKFGTFTTDQSGTCLQRYQFQQQDKCETYCAKGRCKATKNPDGDPVYECDCQRKPSGCSERNYTSKQECEWSCDGGKCTETEGELDVVCKQCPKTCKKGSYKDFDDCDQHCYKGQCSQNAGEKGVSCSC